MIWVRILGVLALVVAALGLILSGAKGLESSGEAKADARASAAVAAQRASDATETERRVQAQAGIAHDAQLQTDAARASADRSDRARDALRVQLAAYVRSNRRSADPAASAASYPTDDPIGVLAEVLGRTDDAAGRYSKEADDNWIGWNACFQSYGALTP